jgi:Zn-finger nucleic acid-binding protein
MSASPLGCGNCGQAMRALTLTGHYGRAVEIDACEGCHLVWFDTVETARLSGPGLLDLITTMARAQQLPHQALRSGLRCARCTGPVHTVHNQSRWGRSMQLECRDHKHGAYRSFAQFLSEKGLTRPMTSADRAQLLGRDGALHCINCGGALDAQAADCPWCRSVPAVIDIARLARALDPEGATADQAVHQTSARHGALQCLACGAAQPPGPALWSCGQCGSTLAAAGLAEAQQRVQALGPALRAHASKPVPAVVARRLETQNGNLQRQRDWAAEMQADADATMGRRSPTEWGWGQVPAGRWRFWLMVVGGLLLWWLMRGRPEGG